MKYVNPRARTSSGYQVYLNELGGQSLEYKYLHALTKDPQFYNRVKQIATRLGEMNKPKGLYMDQMNVYRNSWSSDVASFFSTGATFYTYLVKSHLLSGGYDMESLQMYQQAIAAANRQFMFNTSGVGKEFE